MKVGITGGIGSGKSTVCRLFSLLGVPVFDSDRRARELMQDDAGVVEAVRELFGPASYSGGELDRGYISGMVFSDKELLGKLNGIVHPAVFSDFERWCLLQQGAGVSYAVMESAILFESGMNRYVDRTILVDAPTDVRIDRVVRRDSTTREKVLERIKNQGGSVAAAADYVIDNSGEMLLWPQVLDVDNSLRR